MSTRLKIQYVVYLILILCRNSEEAEEPTATQKISKKLLFCSGQLSIFISQVCNNEYKIVKRDTSVFMEKLAPKSVQEQKTKQRLLAKERWRRFRRQVATECCDNACTVGNIIMYCPDDSKVIRANPDLFED